MRFSLCALLLSFLLTACSDSNDNASGSGSVSTNTALGVAAPPVTNVSHPMFLSPHVNPIVSNGHYTMSGSTKGIPVKNPDQYPMRRSGW